VWWGTTQVDHDDGFVRRRRSLRAARLEPKHVGQSQAGKAQRSYLQKIPTREAIAQWLSFVSPDGEHCQVLRIRGEVGSFLTE